MKKIITTIFVIIILGTVAFVLTRKTSDWQTYSNTRYEFRIDYPADWTLGEAETNNAGRELNSSDGKAYCYAYGFANALKNEYENPQSLDEFIDWLLNKQGVLERNASIIDDVPAIHLLMEEDGNIKESVYALGSDTGIGIFCIYSDKENRNEYKTTFFRMLKSIRIDISLDGTAAKNLASCSDLAAGILIPLKDLQTFVDDEYAEVTMTSKDAWDRDRLPPQVTEFEGKGYDCFPMPLEFDGGEAEGDMLPQPSVTLVEWSCELEYEEWEYIQGLEFMWPSDDFESKWTNCEKEDCWSDDGDDNYIWLCTK